MRRPARETLSSVSSAEGERDGPCASVSNSVTFVFVCVLRGVLWTVEVFLVLVSLHHRETLVSALATGGQMLFKIGCVCVCMCVWFGGLGLMYHIV